MLTPHRSRFVRHPRRHDSAVVQCPEPAPDARGRSTMKYGITMFPTDYSISATELARACEDLGFESLFYPEHTHIPANRRTPYPAGGDLPKEYSHLLDPFVALGAVAAVTTTLKVGTGICLVIERDPITL